MTTRAAALRKRGMKCIATDHRLHEFRLTCLRVTILVRSHLPRHSVRRCRSDSGLEADVIIGLADGRRAAFEVEAKFHWPARRCEFIGCERCIEAQNML